jgi:hypothetical protein
MILTMEKSSGRNPCLSVNLSATNPTWTGLRPNQGLRGDRTAINRLMWCYDSLNSRPMYGHYQHSTFFDMLSKSGDKWSNTSSTSRDFSLFIFAELLVIHVCTYLEGPQTGRHLNRSPWVSSLFKKITKTFTHFQFLQQASNVATPP